MMRIPAVVGVAVTLAVRIAAYAAVPAAPPQTFVLEQGVFHGTLDAPQIPQLALQGDFTIEGWLLLERDSPNSVFLGRVHGDGCPTPDAALFFCSGRSVKFGVSDGAHTATTAAYTVPMRTWTHVAGVRQGATLRLFINAVEFSTTSDANLRDPSSSTSIGVARNINGAVRQLRVWSRALSRDEVAAAAVTPANGHEPSLVVSWQFNEGSGTTIHDRGPYRADLAISRRRPFDTTPRWAHSAVVDSGPFFELGDFVNVAPFCFEQGKGPCMAAPTAIDFDGDRQPDVVVRGTNGAGVPTPAFAFRNDGNSHFTDVRSTVFGPNPPTEPGGGNSLVADFNGDGREDLFWGVIGLDAPPFPGGQSRLFLQTPSGGLSDVTSTNLPQVNAFNDGGGAAADFDGDGDIDIFFGDLGHPAVYLNDGAGKFSVASDALPSNLLAGSQGGAFTTAVAGDFRRIGANDLVLGWMQQTGVASDVILLNDGHGHFTRGDSSAIPPRQTGPEGFTNQMRAADFDGDGWLDIIAYHGKVGFAGNRLVLLLNNHNGTFRDASSAIQQAWAEDTSFSHVHVADFNGDAKPDVLVENHTQGTLHLFINTGRGVLLDASDAVPADLDYMENAAVADFAGSGRSDIFALQGQWYHVLHSIKAFDVKLLLDTHRRAAPH